MQRQTRGIIIALSFALLGSSSSILASPIDEGVPPPDECHICIESHVCEDMIEACEECADERGGLWAADDCDEAPSDCGTTNSLVICECIGGNCNGGLPD